MKLLYLKPSGNSKAYRVIAIHRKQSANSLVIISQLLLYHIRILFYNLGLLFVKYFITEMIGSTGNQLACQTIILDKNESIKKMLKNLKLMEMSIIFVI